MLRGKHKDYHLNEFAYRYIKEQGFPYPRILLLKRSIGKSFSNKSEWEAYLKFLGIKEENHVKTATEAALLGSLIFHGVPEDLVIVSDEAGQFNIFIHALCWIHAEQKFIQFHSGRTSGGCLLTPAKTIKKIKKFQKEDKKAGFNNDVSIIFTDESGLDNVIP